MKTFRQILDVVIDFSKEAWDLWRYLLRYLRGKIFPKSLLGRFILIIVLPLIALQVVAGTAFFDNHWRTISRQFGNNIAGEIKMMGHMIEKYETSEETLHMLSKTKEFYELEPVFYPDNVIDFSKIDVPKSSLVRQLRKALAYIEYPFFVDEKLDEDRVIVYVQLENGVLSVVVPTGRFFSKTTYAFLLWMTGASVLIFWIAFLFMKNQVRSVTRLSRAARDFGTGRAVGNFKPEGALEVRQAGHAFLEMKDRIVKYLSERTGMLSAVSHDLRTPLTRMKLQLSMMQGQEAADLLEDVAEMQKMLEGYLSFARGEGKEEMQTMEVSDLLTEVVEKLRRNGCRIDLHIEQKQQISLRPNDFARAITNILTNANRYATNAFVNMGIRDSHLDITIDDDGKGIPQDKRNDVFKAFYRLDSSRNTETGGLGLGLTITRDIVLSHGGNISLEDSSKGGLRVHLQFPI